jgi:hypothetical protein
MATTTNYGWTTPDDTALVKDGAAAIRSLGTAIDTSFAADEGDLLVGGTSDIFEALPIGAAGTVLTSDGDTAEWAAPAAGGKSYSLINSPSGTTLSGTETSITGISGMDDLFILIYDASSDFASSFIRYRFNTNTGSVYNISGQMLTAGNTYASSMVNREQGVPTTSVNFARTGNNVASGVSGYLRISGCNSTGVKIFQSQGAVDANGDSGRNYNLGGFFDSTATISSIQIISSAGSFDSGTVYIYGSA